MAKNSLHILTTNSLYWRLSLAFTSGFVGLFSAIAFFAGGTGMGYFAGSVSLFLLWLSIQGIKP